MNLAPSLDHIGGVVRDQLENEQDSGSRLESHRLKAYRDIPIYTEPGSPVLNRAYLTDEEVHSSCNTSESDEWFEANDSSGIEREPFDYVDEFNRREVFFFLSVEVSLQC
jgi:hypothetical protein